MKKLKNFALAATIAVASLSNVEAQEKKEAPIQLIETGIDYMPNAYANGFGTHIFLSRSEIKNPVLNRVVPKYSLICHSLSKDDWYSPFVRVFNKTGIAAKEGDGNGVKFAKRLVPASVETDILVLPNKTNVTLRPVWNTSININNVTKGLLPSEFRPVLPLDCSPKSVIVGWSPDKIFGDNKSKLTTFVPYHLRAQFGKAQGDNVSMSSIEGRFNTSKLEPEGNTTFKKILKEIIPDETWIGTNGKGNLNMASVIYKFK